MPRRACRLAPFGVLLWRLATLAAAAAPVQYTDPDGWARAPECLNWNEDEGPFGGMQPVDDFQEIIPERLYPAIYKNINIPAWRKCCQPAFNLLQACYQVGFPMPPDFNPPDGPNVHVIVRISCTMTCGLMGRLRSLLLSPLTVEAEAHVPVEAKYGPVQFGTYKIKTKALPQKMRYG